MIRLDENCTLAQDYLRRPGKGKSEALLEHVHSCQSCQAYFTENETAFLEHLDRDPLGSLGNLAIEANRRVGAPVGKSPAPVSADNWTTPEINGYALGEQIGQTRNSKVFIATQLSLHRQVALKIVRTGKSGTHQYTLAREAAMMAWLKSPYILTIHETGIWEGGIWLALEYCPKGSLSDALAAGERFDEREAADLIRKVASAVHVANRQGFIHRDIKPGNILIGQANQPRLADFGLAMNAEEIREESLAGNLSGTPSYMAPEQIMNQPVDVRADVYGLGAVLYHLLTGHAPFRAGSRYEAMLLAAHTPPLAPELAKPGISRDLNHICMKCLAKEPASRYPSAKELADDLQRFLEGEPVRARPLGKVEAVRRWMGRNRALTATLSAAFLFLTAALAGFAGLSFWALEERNKAERNEARVRDQNRLAELRGYTGNIQRANQELENGSTRAAEDLLASCPIPLRGWEHDHIFWKLRQNQVTLSGHHQDVNCLALGADGVWLTSGSDDGTVRLWNTQTGEMRGLLVSQKHAIGQLFFTPESERLLIASECGKLLIWNATAHTLETPLDPGPLGPSPASKFGRGSSVTPDGNLLIAEGPGHCMTVWDIPNRKFLRKTDWTHETNLWTAAVAPSGKIAASSENKSAVVVWETETGKKRFEIRTIRGVTRALAFSPDGTLLATGSDDDLVRIWDTQNGKLVHTLEGHSDWIRTLAFSPDGAWLASGADDHLVKIWDPYNGNEMRSYRGHNDLVRCLCFSPDSRRLISGGMDHTIRIWDLSTSQDPLSFTHPEKTRVARFSRDGSQVATGCDDGRVRLWNKESGRLIVKLEGHKKAVESLCYSPQGETLASGGEDGSIRIWKPSSRLQVLTLGTSKQAIRGLCFSPDGEKLYSIGTGGLLQGWNLAKGELEFEIKAHDKAGTVLAISKDGNLLATGGTDEKVRLWSTSTQECILTLNGHTHPVISLAFSPDGRHLASGSDGRSIFIWDLESGKAVRRLFGHKSGVTSLEYNPDGTRLLSSSFDNTVKIWDPVEGTDILTVTRHKTSTRCVTVSPDGKDIASASDDGQVIVCQSTIQMESLLLQGRRGRIEEAGFELGRDPIRARDNMGNVFHCDPMTGLEITQMPGGPMPDLTKKTTTTSEDKKWLIEQARDEFLLIDTGLREERQNDDRKRLDKWTKVFLNPQGN